MNDLYLLPGNVLGGALLRDWPFGDKVWDTRLPWVQDWIARVLRAGEQCPNCGGRGVLSRDPEDEDCPSCDGDGCTRPPHDIHHLITAALPPTWVAALVWASVLWVEDGRELLGWAIDGDTIQIPTPGGTITLDRAGNEVTND